jgi:hypothetical protein
VRRVKVGGLGVEGLAAQVRGVTTSSTTKCQWRLVSNSQQQTTANDIAVSSNQYLGELGLRLFSIFSFRPTLMIGN